MSVLRMSSPFKHPKTSVHYLRVRVPTDLVRLAGRREVKRTLGTKDPAEAKRRFAEELQKVHREWERLRSTPDPLSRQQVVALAGQLYRELVSLDGQAPESDAPVWRAVGALFGRLSDAPSAAREGFLGTEVDRLLSEAGLHADAASRTAIIAEVIKAAAEAAEANERVAEGDFTPDPRASRFPPMPAPKVAPKAAEGVTIGALLEAWKREHSAAGGSASTTKAWERMVADFTAYLRREGLGNGDDATAAMPKHISALADHLRHDRGLSAKTVNGKYLSALGTIYRTGRSRPPGWLPTKGACASASCALSRYSPRAFACPTFISTLPTLTRSLSRTSRVVTASPSGDRTVALRAALDGAPKVVSL